MQGGGGRAPRPGALGSKQTTGQLSLLHLLHLRRHMAGLVLVWHMEADVLVLLAVPADHCALYTGALGANRAQFDAGSVVGMALYTGYVFMHQHIMAILHYFGIEQ